MIRMILLESCYRISITMLLVATFMVCACGDNATRIKDQLAKAEALQEAKDYDGAIQILEKVINEYPKNTDARLKLALVYAIVNRKDAAIHQCQYVIDLCPNLGKAHYFLGAMYLAKRMNDPAVFEITKAIDLGLERTVRIEAYQNLARAYRSKGMFREAAKQYERALEIEPKNADLIDGLRELNTIINRLEKPTPLSAEEHNNLGMIYFTNHKYHEAIAEYKKALALDQNAPNIHSNLGIALLAVGKHNEGVDQIKRAIELNPKDANLHVNLGSAYHSKGIIDETLEEYRKALKIDPHNVHAMGALKTVNGEDGYQVAHDKIADKHGKLTDSWTYTNQAGKAYKRVYDMNHDGKPDCWTYLDKEGKKYRADYDTEDMDGRVDMSLYYDSNEKLYETTSDTDADGAIDLWVYYDEDKKPYKESIDHNKDGIPDIWIYVDSQRQISRIGYNPDQDDKIDLWDHYRDGKVYKTVMGKTEESVRQRPDLVEPRKTYLFYCEEEVRLAKEARELAELFLAETIEYGGPTPATLKAAMQNAHKKGQNFLVMINRSMKGRRYKDTIELGKRAAEELEGEIEIGEDFGARTEMVALLREELFKIYTVLSEAYGATGRQSERYKTLAKARKLRK